MRVAAQLMQMSGYVTTVLWTVAGTDECLVIFVLGSVVGEGYFIALSGASIVPELANWLRECLLISW